MRHYMILCHARTGSNYLFFALKQHPEIMAHNELFYEHTIYHADGEIRKASVLAERDKDPIAYLEQVLGASTKPVSGFKHLLFYPQIVTDYVMAKGFKLIILERHNILSQYSSMKIALQTNQWTLKQGVQALESPKLAWDEADFENYRREYSEAYAAIDAQLAQCNPPYLKLEYLDLFKAETMPRIFEFLGVNKAFVINPETLRKQNTSTIVERFQDAALVSAYLQRIGHPEWAIEGELGQSSRLSPRFS